MIPLYGDGGRDREAQIEAWLKRTGRISALLAEERDALLMTEREDDGEEADAEGT